MVNHNINNKGINWKVYKGKEYLNVSFYDLDEVGVIALYMEMATILRDHNKEVLLLSDFKGVNISRNIIRVLKNIALPHQKYLKKSAVIGMSNHIVQFYRIYKSLAKSKAIPFNTEIEALEYLIP